MRGIWAGGPGLLLGLLVAGAQAGEVQWYPSAPGPAAAPQQPPSSSALAPCVGLGRPVALAAPSPAPTASPLVALGRPIPANAGAGLRLPLIDTQVQPVSYSNTVIGVPQLTVRAKADDPQPMPLGQPLKGPPLIETPLDTGSQGPVVGNPPAPAKIFVMAPSPAPMGPAFDPKLVPDSGVYGGDSPAGDSCAGNSCAGCGGNPCCGGDPCCGDCCGDLCCEGCNACGNCGDCPGLRSRSFWVRGEYLLWGIKDSHSPPLVTTGSQSDPAPGVIGQPHTQVLFGGTMDNEEFSGGRLEAGGWFGDDQLLGLEGGLFFIGPRTNHFFVGSDASGLPALYRPVTGFSSANTAGVPGDEVVASPVGPPALTTGNISVTSRSRLFGGDLNAITNLDRCCWYRLDLLAGVRYLQLDESLDIQETLATPSLGNAFDSTDHFGTRNQFYGGQLGLRSEFYWRRWQLDVSGKLALGETHEVVNINGASVLTQPGFAPITGAGLLAENTNGGTHSRDQFAVVPELGLNLGYQFTDHWRAYVGYNFLYWSKVVRPGEQIDSGVNLSQNPAFGGSGTLVGPVRPAFTFHDSSFWAQGANVGLEYRW